MNVIVPASRTTVPPSGFETPVTVRLSPSVSVSSSARSEAVIVTSWSSVPEASSSVAAGLSFSQLMLTTT